VPLLDVASSASLVTLTLWAEPSGGSQRGRHKLAKLDSSVSALVRVPDTGAIESRVLSAQLVDLDGRPLPTTPAEILDQLAYVGPPAIVRGLRVVRATFEPSAEWAGSLLRVSAVTLEIGRGGGDGLNEVTRPARPLSAAFERLFRRFVVNYERPGSTDAEAGGREDLSGRRDSDSGRARGGRYLVIAADDLVEELEPLLQRKEEKGLLPHLTRLSEIDPTPQGMRSYIKNAYDNWEVPPEYVLLVGDTEELPTFWDEVPTDNYFAAVDGDDCLADLIVGRLPADSPAECAAMVAKTLAYDEPWLHWEPDWPLSGVLLVQDDYDDGDTLYYSNTWFVRDLMDSAGFVRVDTLFAKNGVTLDDTYAALNRGAGFVNYRGRSGPYWPYGFNVAPWELENLWRLPVVVSATCNSGGFLGDEYLSEQWLRAGTAEDPIGGAGFFGTGTSGDGLEVSLERGVVDEEFFSSAFGDGRTLGEACLAGKLALFAYSGNQTEYEGWNLLGDPEGGLWSDRPGSLDVSWDCSVAEGTATLDLHVASGGVAIDGAEVACYDADRHYAAETTDGSGWSELVIAEVVPPCTVSVSVQAKNVRPYRSSVVLINRGPFLAFAELDAADDLGGNGDGAASPGEDLTLRLRLSNPGDEPASGVQARLGSPDEWLSIIDSTAVFPDIAAGASAWCSDPFEVRVSGNWPGGYDIPLALAIDYGDSSTFFSIPPLRTVTGLLTVTSVQWDDAVPYGDGDSVPSAGEAAVVTVALRNEAFDRLVDVSTTLSAGSGGIHVSQGTSWFTAVEPGSVAFNRDEPYMLSIAPDIAYDDTVALKLTVSGSTTEFAYLETLRFGLVPTSASGLRPTGPDAHGYYAYDSSDALHDETQPFEWVEIAPPGPGYRLDSVSDGNDATALVAPPFLIMYYGQPCYWMSVCSNGFVSLTQTSDHTSDNAPIPSFLGPPGMLAPFWDDLDPSSGGDVYVWQDTEEHRCVVEYSEVVHAGGESPETFELIIFDPSAYPTPTGDSRILFQYASVSETGGCTVGIESLDETVGLEYLHNGRYAPYAAGLRDSMAVLFSTSPPSVVSLPWLVVTGTSTRRAKRSANAATSACDTLLLAVTLSNMGSAAAAASDLLLTCADQAVAVVDSTSSMPSLVPGVSFANDQDPFVVAVAGLPSGAVIPMTLRVDSGTGGQRSLVCPLRIEPSEESVVSLLLSHPVPNPSSGAVSFQIGVARPGRYTLSIYNVCGRLVRRLAGVAELAGRQQQVSWNGTDSDGRRVASGVYFARLVSGGESRTRKLVLLR
jgi:hypothetical protein